VHTENAGTDDCRDWEEFEHGIEFGKQEGGKTLFAFFGKAVDSGNSGGFVISS
jgi:hypothetical protein